MTGWPRQVAGQHVRSSCQDVMPGLVEDPASTHPLVMPGLDPGIHLSSRESCREGFLRSGWIAGSADKFT